MRYTNRRILYFILYYVPVLNRALSRRLQLSVLSVRSRRSSLSDL